MRRLDESGHAAAEIVTDYEPADQANGRPLLIPFVRGGEAVGREPVTAARSRHQQAVTELPAHARQLSRGYPAIPTVFEPDRD